MGSNTCCVAFFVVVLLYATDLQADIAISVDGVVVSAPSVQFGEICVNSFDICEVTHTIAGGWWLKRQMKPGDVVFFVDRGESTRRLVEAKTFYGAPSEGWDKLLFTGFGAFIGLLANFLLQFAMRRSREHDDSREKIRVWRTLTLAAIERWRLKKDLLIKLPELPSLSVRDLRRIEGVRKALKSTENQEEIKGINRYILADEMRNIVIELRSSAPKQGRTE